MNAALLSAVKSVNADHLSFKDRTDSVLPASPEAHTQVGGSRLGHIAMTNEEREQAAYRAGVAMQSWYSTYQHTRDPSALDRAYHHLGQMRQILAGRSAEVVARMERERGLR